MQIFYRLALDSQSASGQDPPISILPDGIKLTDFLCEYFIGHMSLNAAQ